MAAIVNCSLHRAPSSFISPWLQFVSLIPLPTNCGYSPNFVLGLALSVGITDLYSLNIHNTCVQVTPMWPSLVLFSFPPFALLSDRMSTYTSHEYLRFLRIKPALLAKLTCSSSQSRWKNWILHWFLPSPSQWVLQLSLFLCESIFLFSSISFSASLTTHLFSPSQAIISIMIFIENGLFLLSLSLLQMSPSQATWCHSVV